MECPKCGGGAYLSDEDLIQVLETKDVRSPSTKLMLKATYACRACSEKFTRIVYDDLNARKKQDDARPAYGFQQPAQQQSINPYDYPSKPTIVKAGEETGDPAEGLKFF